MEYFDGTICFLYTMVRLNRLMQWYMVLELSVSGTADLPRLSKNHRLR